VTHADSGACPGSHGSGNSSTLKGIFLALAAPLERAFVVFGVSTGRII
jgi:hypothetical protein